MWSFDGVTLTRALSLPRGPTRFQAGALWSSIKDVGHGQMAAGGSQGQPGAPEGTRGDPRAAGGTRGNPGAAGGRNSWFYVDETVFRSSKFEV